MLDKLQSQLKNLAQYPLVKVLGAETGIIIQIFNETQMALATVMCLVFVDLMFGFLAAYRFRCVTSWKFKDSINKLAFYAVLIVGSSAIQVLWNVPWVKEAFIGLIVSTEILSILENVEINFPGFLPSKIMAKLGVTFTKRRAKHGRH